MEAATDGFDSLKAKLKRAIASGRQKGVDTSAWEQRLRLLEQAEHVAQETRRLLDTRGWCLWQCAALSGETIALIRDESVKSTPPGYAEYTEEELRKLTQMKKTPWRLVYEAKKLAGARVIQVEIRTDDAV